MEVAPTLLVVNNESLTSGTEGRGIRARDQVNLSVCNFQKLQLNMLHMPYCFGGGECLWRRSPSSPWSCSRSARAWKPRTTAQSPEELCRDDVRSLRTRRGG